ncbi:MAG: hypothetical protein ACD_9C00168G0001 [uncultured bacterium]|nr:MAG: hypothetical protein ACD_9C00168G0001 [uncultured bacterium]
MKISISDYAKTLNEMTKGKPQNEIDGIVFDFAKFLMKKKQSGKIEKIVRQFSNIWNTENKNIDCEVSSMEKLSDATVEKIKQYIKEKYQAETVNIENKIDKGLKGGIILRVGDEMTDMSVQGMLSQLKKQLNK